MSRSFESPKEDELPREAITLLRMVDAPPRLLAHSTLVHDAARRLLEGLSASLPELLFDRDAVLFGAAIHDIGKAVERRDLSLPGTDHERRGFQLLCRMGVREERARFAHTHGNWAAAETITLEDLLVALADTCWKGGREEELEARITSGLQASTGRPAWLCYSTLDRILTEIGEDAAERLVWQQSFPACGRQPP